VPDGASSAEPTRQHMKAQMNRVVLMLAFHFPPFAQSTGVQRVLSFARHLPRHGWKPIVLTARKEAYPEIDASSLAQLPPDLEVVRAWAVDVGRRVAIRGRYPSWVATPDRWATWALGACCAGLRVVRTRSPAVIWATFPIPSALLAALLLHRVSGLPLVADLRDPIVYESWPTMPRLRRVYGWIERLVVRSASAVVVTTPGARKLYIDRYPELPPSRFRVIPNGIDDSIPSDTSPITNTAANQTVTLVHSGLMEIPDRDPSPFFEALRNMLCRGEIDDSSLRIVLRASGQDAEFRRKIDDFGIGRIVILAPRLSREEAMKELLTATGLLLFQGETCNRQIPAKAYEYLASRRPILGLCHPGGDTHELLQDQWRIPYLADMASAERIEDLLRRFISDVRSRATFVPSKDLLLTHSRSSGALELAHVLCEVAGLDTEGSAVANVT